MERPTRRVRWLLQLGLGAFAVVVATYFSLFALSAGSRHDRVLRAWSRTLGTTEEILERWPAREANDAALELEKLTPPLGVGIAPRHRTERPDPTHRQKRELFAAKKSMVDWLTRQIERDSPAIAPPPDAVVAFRETHGETLSAVRRSLLDNEIPLWESDLSKLFAAPIPNLLGHLDLQRLLLADALAAAQEGDSATAAEALEASWRLNQSLADEPTLITQLIRITIARLQAGVVRQVDAPEVWLERVDGRVYRRALETALMLEAWVWVKIDPGAVAATTGWAGKVFGVAVRPYARLCMADISDRWRRRLVRLSKLDYLCDRDLALLGADLEIELPFWNRLDQIVPGLSGSVQRAARLELDLELTAKLLDLDAGRRAAGRWPPRTAEIEHSSVCPNDRWIYRLGPGPSMSLSLDRPVAWQEARGAVLPTRFEAGGAGR